MTVFDAPIPHSPSDALSQEELACWIAQTWRDAGGHHRGSGKRPGHELANCHVLGRPVYRDSGKKQKWTCVLHAQSSIFQPDIDMEVTASATNELAIRAQRKSFKPGDRVVLTGILRDDTMSNEARVAQ